MRYIGAVVNRVRGEFNTPHKYRSNKFNESRAPHTALALFLCAVAKFPTFCVYTRVYTTGGGELTVRFTLGNCKLEI